MSLSVAKAFMHHAFDDRTKKDHADLPFERYADDLLAYGRSHADALQAPGSTRGQPKI
jgi:hypothetical protein